MGNGGHRMVVSQPDVLSHAPGGELMPAAATPSKTLLDCPTDGRSTCFADGCRRPTSLFRTSAASTLNHPQRFLPLLLSTLDVPGRAVQGYQDLLHELLDDPHATNAIACFVAQRLADTTALRRDLDAGFQTLRRATTDDRLTRKQAVICKCEDRACGRLRERSECLTANQRVAEDLYNFEIAPEDLGIGDASLRARVLVLKLKDLGLPPAPSVTPAATPW